MTTRQRALPNVVITPRSDPVRRHLNPVRLVTSLWLYRGLIAQFTRREIEGRYRSSFLGFTWSFVQPVVLLCIYTFVFGVVLKARWPDTRTDRLSEFGLVLFAGLIGFGIFSESVNRAATLIVGVPNYVKRVVFPLEVLPVSVLGSALFHASVSLSVLLVANLFLYGQLPWTVVLMPVVILPLVLLESRVRLVSREPWRVRTGSRARDRTGSSGPHVCHADFLSARRHSCRPQADCQHEPAHPGRREHAARDFPGRATPVAGTCSVGRPCPPL